jgi:hypothetical protein
MKKNTRAVYVVYINIAILACGIISACTSGPPAADQKEQSEFKLRRIAVSVLLFPELINGSPRMNFNLRILGVSGPEDLKNFFETLLYDGQTIDEYKRALIADYRAAYRSMRQGLSDIGINSPRMDWEYIEYMDIRTFSDCGMVIGRKIEYFTGGAHGMSEKIYYVVDIKEQKLLHWQELFVNPESPELYRVILDGLRKYAGMEKDAPLSSGIYFEDEPEISGNFFPAAEGLGLRWNPYEIGPYSEGSIEIIIPWEKIRHLLSKEGRLILSEWFRRKSI